MSGRETQARFPHVEAGERCAVIFRYGRLVQDPTEIDAPRGGGEDEEMGQGQRAAFLRTREVEQLGAARPAQGPLAALTLPLLPPQDFMSTS